MMLAYYCLRPALMQLCTLLDRMHKHGLSERGLRHTYILDQESQAYSHARKTNCAASRQPKTTRVCTLSVDFVRTITHCNPSLSLSSIMSAIKTVGVISTGVIGSSFVALFLSHGLRVLVCSPSGSPTAESKLASYLEQVWPTIPLDRRAADASLSNYRFVGTSFDGYYDQIDFVQENTPERLDLKRAILASLDANLRPEVIIASSTSGIVASKLIADCSRYPERILVGHPYNPPHLIPLVEVVPHAGSDAGICERALAFYRSVGRKPVLVKKEVPGFVANRLQAVLLREAFSLVLDGVVTAEELGKRCTLSIHSG